nr:protein NYNRIN-like [Tanacetum cinerariifolium]
MSGCQLVNSPIILEALIEVFQVRRIYVDGLSSSEVMYEHCFRNLGTETNAKLKEPRTPLVGFSGETPELEGTTIKGKEESRGQTDKTKESKKFIQPSPIPSEKDTQGNEKGKENDEILEKLPEGKPPKKVIIHDDHPDQTITIKGNLTAKCRSGLIKILRKHADAFAWTPTDMIEIPYFVMEHELTTYPHIEPRVQRKRSIASDRRKKLTERSNISWDLNTNASWMPTKDTARATYQRLVDTIFKGKKGRNLEAYVDDMVIKSKTKLKMIKEVDETLLTLKKSPIPSEKDTQGNEKGKEKDEILEKLPEGKPPKKVIIHDDHPDQTITIKGNLTAKCRSGLIKILRKHADAFAWTPTDMIEIPYFVMEYELTTHPHIEPRVQRKRSIALDRRKKLTGRSNISWDLNTNASWMPTKDTTRATYQRLVDTIFKGKIGRNLEAYVDDMVIKSKTKLEMIKEVDETLLTLKKKMKKLITELPTLTAPKKEEELMVYLSTANEAVSVILLVERDRRQTLIHYVSRTLQGTKINYPPMEKLALELVHAARRLRRYFQGHTIKVIMNKPISQILNNREATRRLAKWGVELEAYDIKYTPRSTIKGQVLADFLADTMAKDSPAQAKADRSGDTLTKGENPEEQGMTETQASADLKAETDIWKVYID